MYYQPELKITWKVSLLQKSINCKENRRGLLLQNPASRPLLLMLTRHPPQTCPGRVEGEATYLPSRRDCPGKWSLRGRKRRPSPLLPKRALVNFQGSGLSAGTSPALGPVGLTSSSWVHCGPLIAGPRQVTLTRPQSRFPGLTESRARGAGWQVGPEGLNPHARAARGAGRPPRFCPPPALPAVGAAASLPGLPEPGQSLPLARWCFLAPKPGPREGERDRIVPPVPWAESSCRVRGVVALPLSPATSAELPACAVRAGTGAGRRPPAVIPAWQRIDSERRDMTLKYGS